jgi:hypothetical protein
MSKIFACAVHLALKELASIVMVSVSPSDKERVAEVIDAVERAIDPEYADPNIPAAFSNAGVVAAETVEAVPVTANVAVPLFDPMTGERLAPEPVPAPVPRFDPMTGLPLSNS